MIKCLELKKTYEKNVSKKFLNKSVKKLFSAERSFHYQGNFWL